MHNRHATAGHIVDRLHTVLSDWAGYPDRRRGAVSAVAAMVGMIPNTWAQQVLRAATGRGIDERTLWSILAALHRNRTPVLIILRWSPSKGPTVKVERIRNKAVEREA